MEPSELRELLSVLREAGATSARVPTLLGQLEVVLGPVSSGEIATAAEPAPEDEDLPEGAYDPIRRRKQRQPPPAPPDEAS